MGLIAELFMAAGMAAYNGVRKKLGLGPSRRQLERQCDSMNLYPYTAENLQRARDYLNSVKK